MRDPRRSAALLSVPVCLSALGCAAIPSESPRSAADRLTVRARSADSARPADDEPLPTWVLLLPEPGRRPVRPALRLRPNFEAPVPADLLAVFQPGGPAEATDGQAPTAAQLLGVEQGRGPLPSVWDTLRRDFKDMPNELWENTKEIVFRPLPMAILIAGGAASVPIFKYVDPPIVRYYGGTGPYRNVPPVWVRDLHDHLGNPAHHAAAAAVMYGIAVCGDDAKFYDFSKSMLYALALTDLATGGLKVVINQKSPNGKRWGFPSGHTSSTIAFASVIHQYYGPWVAAPFYGLSVYVGWGRLWDREHRFSDVVYGAILGLVIGHAVGARGHIRFMDMNLMPMVEPDPRGGTFTGIMLAGQF